MAIFPDKGGYNPLATKLFDDLAPKIAAPFHAWVMDHLPGIVDPARRLLDVGCGGGQVAVRMSETFPDLEIVGIDPSAGMIARANARAATRSGLSFQRAGAEALPFADGSFEVVVAIGSFKHWPDQRKGLAECVRVLAPGGRLMVMEADRDSRPQDVEAFIRAWTIAAPLRWLIGHALRRMVRQALTVGQVQAMVDTVPGIDATVRSVEGLPAWVIEGRRLE